MSNSANGGFAKPTMLQVATTAEAMYNPDMLLVRYNGHPNEDTSDFQLENRGADYQWYGTVKGRGFGSGYPVRVRAGRYCAIPNCKENLEILEKMKTFKWTERVKTDSGHINKAIEHPPLYELVQEEIAQVSADAVLAAIMRMSDADKAAILGLVTEPPAAPSPTAPVFALDETPVSEVEVKVEPRNRSR